MEIAGLSGGAGDNNTVTSYTFYPTQLGFLEQNFGLKKFYEYTLNITYNDGSTETMTAVAVPIYNTIGINVGQLNDSNVYFALYDNASVDDDYDFVYTEGKSIYGLMSNDGSCEIASVTIDFNNSHYFEQFGALFTDGTYLTWNELKTKYNITDTTIPADAFKNCEVLFYIHIPDTVTYIGEHAFSYCYNLLGMSILNGDIQIENYALANTRIDYILFNCTLARCEYAIGSHYPCEATTIYCLDGITELNTSK